MCRRAGANATPRPPAGPPGAARAPPFGELGEGFLGLAGRAFQLAEWARTHRFCGVCGNPMALAEGERSFKCSRCGNIAYPRISPAMMVLIRKGDKVLLAKHAKAATTRYVPLAGFLE